MSFANILEAVREKFRDDVATPNSMAVLQDNAPPSATISQSWYRLTVLVDSTEQMSAGKVGSRRYRVMGHAVLNLFVPVGRGDGAMLDLVDAVTTAFRGASIASPAICFEPPPSLSGPAERSEGWFMRTAIIPFDADVFG